MLQRVARRYRALVGGSYLEMRDGDVYNTYVLAEPDGTLHRHDKDQPTMVENAFYIGGSDDGLFETQLGAVGVAVCWETVRTRTVQRLRGKVGLLMTGSHWWSEPGWPWPKKLWNKLHENNAELMKRTPGAFARLIAAPSLHAAHAGKIRGKFLLTPAAAMAVDTHSQLMGETQIIDAKGSILARRSYAEGAGIATADISLGIQPAVDLIPPRFWIPELDVIFRALWHHQNFCGKRAYLCAKRRGLLRSGQVDERGVSSC